MAELEETPAAPSRVAGAINRSVADAADAYRAELARLADDYFGTVGERTP